MDAERWVIAVRHRRGAGAAVRWLPCRRGETGVVLGAMMNSWVVDLASLLLSPLRSPVGSVPIELTSDFRRELDCDSGTVVWDPSRATRDGPTCTAGSGGSRISASRRPEPFLEILRRLWFGTRSAGSRAIRARATDSSPMGLLCTRGALSVLEFPRVCFVQRSRKGCLE